MSVVAGVIGAGALIVFLAFLLPIFLLALGFNMFLAPIFGLPILDFWQGVGLYLLLLGFRFVVVPINTGISAGKD